MRRALAALVVAIAIVGSGGRADAADDDPWLGPDKALHFGVSAGIAAGGYAAGAAIFDARGHALLFGGGIAAACGIAKETADLAGFGDPSWRDLAWDGIGTIVGVAVAWGIDLLVRGVDTTHPAFERGRSGIAF